MTGIALLAISNLLNSADPAKKSQDQKINAIGIYLDSPNYDQAAFALLEQAEDAMEQAFPGMPWEAIDSASPKVKTLPSPLPVLAKLTAPKPDSHAILLARSIGSTFAKSHILLIHRGGTRAERDSSKSFSDRSSFSLVECSTGHTVFLQEFQATGQRGKLSAESAWAKDAWSLFLKSWKARPAEK